MVDKTDNQTPELSITYMLENVTPFYFTRTCIKCAFYDDDDLCNKIVCECKNYYNNDEKVSVCWVKTDKFKKTFLNALRASSAVNTRAVSTQALLNCLKEKNIQSL